LAKKSNHGEESRHENQIVKASEEGKKMTSHLYTFGDPAIDKNLWKQCKEKMNSQRSSMASLGFWKIWHPRNGVNYNVCAMPPAGPTTNSGAQQVPATRSTQQVQNWAILHIAW
jgi:hypothetical protein